MLFKVSKSFLRGLVRPFTRWGPVRWEVGRQGKGKCPSFPIIHPEEIYQPSPRKHIVMKYKCWKISHTFKFLTAHLDEINWGDIFWRNYMFTCLSFAWQKLMKCYMFAPKARWQICCIYIACCWAAPAIYQMLNNIKETSKELRTGQLTMNHSLWMLFWVVLKSGSSTLGAEVVFFPQRFDRYCSIEQVSLSARLHVICFKHQNRKWRP